MRSERALVDRLVAWELSHRHERLRATLPDLTPRSPYCTTVSVINAERGQVRAMPTREKVLILGGGPTRVEAPLDDPTYEVWGCNDLSSCCVDSAGLFRADRWFEVHPRDPVVAWRRRSDFWDWLATVPVPVYQFGRRDNAQSVEYPLESVIRVGRDYFGCTFCYQIGLAYLEGFNTIALYGVDLTTAREATVERGTVEWWAGFVQGRGIEVVWPGRLTPAIRAGRHPYRYGSHADICERERAAVYDWIRDQFQPTIASFLIGNRPPETVREWWAWRRAV